MHEEKEKGMVGEGLLSQEIARAKMSATLTVLIAVGVVDPGDPDGFFLHCSQFCARCKEQIGNHLKIKMFSALISQIMQFKHAKRNYVNPDNLDRD